MIDKAEYIIKCYKEFLIQNNIYTDELFNYGARIFKTYGLKGNYVLYLIKLKDYRNKWKDFYIRRSIVYKIFIRYLKENNIYHKFFKYIENNTLFLSYDFIISYFDWSETYEGNEYWNDKSEKWRQILRTVEL